MTKQEIHDAPTNPDSLTKSDIREAVVKELPNTGFAPSNAGIAKNLRQQADWMEEEDATPIRTVVMIMEREDGKLHRQVIGYGCDMARVIGILSYAQIQAAIESPDE